MHTTNHSSHPDLGAGLVLRWSTPEDAERIATLHSLVHRDSPDAPSNLYYQRQIHALMSGDHPFMTPYDFALIEDTIQEGHPIVATTCLWRHTWSYEGIPFSVGRPEAVATSPTYRHRGLIRELFHMVHARSEAAGDLVQAITGIAYFYRQFGYEYALELEDRRATPLALIPELPADMPEPVTLREATAEDIPLLQRLYKHRREGSIVADLPTQQQWLYEIETWKNHPQWRHTLTIQMICDNKGATIGFVAYDAYRRGRSLAVWQLECVLGINVQAILPSVLRALQTRAQNLETAFPGIPALQEISLSLGTMHPVHQLLGEALDYAREPTYAWYIRVKDLTAFIRHIAPALEQRLALSPVAGYTGEIRINFYRGGLRITFTHGKLVDVTEWSVPIYGPAEHCAFPPLVFLQILFGHRSLEELRHILPDIWISDEVRTVLHVLFPTRPSLVSGWN